jgi:hypothetical protein
MRKMLVCLPIVAFFAVTTPVQASVDTFLGSFTVSGSPGPVSSWGASFRISFDTTASTVNDFTPEYFNLTGGGSNFSATNVTFDTAIAPFSIGARDFMIGRVGSGPGDVNNTLFGFATPADFRFRAILDTDGNLLFARGGYHLSGGPIFSFDTSAADGSSATFSLQAVPEPATWALLVIGFGFVGSACRRRRFVASA